MIIKKEQRKHLVKLLPKNYRVIIVDRLKAKGTTVHPNTVSNVLNGSQNELVALALLELGKERHAFLKLVDKAMIDITA